MTHFLDHIFEPKDLKSLPIESFADLAKEIRQLIINVMAINGGHLSSNLGSVEIILALHRVFNAPIDKLIFDTSHQIYTHKILTGRKDKFASIRTFEGLSGFACPTESIYDHFYAGHAGTGLSLGLGVAKARDLCASSEYIVPVISDAPLACGLTLEAFNNIPPHLKNFIIVLNDNAMAISNGVGNIHNNILGRFQLPRRTLEEAKYFFHPFHLDYIGPINGHDINALVEALEKAKSLNRSVIVHTLTVKGHGMQTAIKDPITYHGVKPFDPESGKFHPAVSNKPTFPKIFGNFVLKMADEDPSVVTLTPAMPRGSCLDKFMEKYPDRCIDVGIAEGHCVTYAGGIAYKSGLKVIAAIYATFFQRALDNLFQDICLQEIPVLFALDRGGLSPQDGTTHHGIYDISFMNTMPHMVIAQPRDGDLLKDLLFSAFSYRRPIAIRYPNLETEETNRPPMKRPLGKGEVLIHGKDITIIALGHMCKIALEVREILLEHDVEATVVDPIFVKPLDSSLFFKLMLDHHYFVTIEEHAVNSGLGSIFNSFVMQSGFTQIQVQNFGIPDHFLEHGTHEELLNQIGLTPNAIANQILERFALHKEKVTS